MRRPGQAKHAGSPVSPRGRGHGGAGKGRTALLSGCVLGMVVTTVLGISSRVLITWVVTGTVVLPLSWPDGARSSREHSRPVRYRGGLHAVILTSGQSLDRAEAIHSTWGRALETLTYFSDIKSMQHLQIPHQLHVVPIHTGGCLYFILWSIHFFLFLASLSIIYNLHVSVSPSPFISRQAKSSKRGDHCIL